MVVARIKPLSLSVAAAGLLALNGNSKTQQVAAFSYNHRATKRTDVSANYARMRTKLLVSTSTPSSNAKVSNNNNTFNDGDRSESDSELPFFLSSASQQQEEFIETTGMPNLVGQLQRQPQPQPTQQQQQVIVNPEQLLQQPLDTELVDEQQVPRRLYSSLKYEKQQMVESRQPVKKVL